MKLDASDIDALRPVIAEAVRVTLEHVRATDSKLGNRIGYTEAEAAALIGVPRHVLRDSRLRGEVSARPIGKKIIYSREALVALIGGQT
ncbi:MAG TPA: hypothetical protein VGJ16_10735 [Pirellulales bacterium]